jgi:hypothetical protein
MWGTTGAPLRRRIIRAEFTLGAVGCLILGALSLRSGNGWYHLVGVWLVGVGANYLVLTVHAFSLLRPGALEAELREIDVRRELRRASVQQMWIGAPFLLAVEAAKRRFGDR